MPGQQVRYVSGCKRLINPGGNFRVPYYMKFWCHVNLAILKSLYLATLYFGDFS